MSERSEAVNVLAGFDTRHRCRCGSFNMRFKPGAPTPGFSGPNLLDGVESVDCGDCGEHQGATLDELRTYSRKILAETDGYGPPSWHKSPTPMAEVATEAWLIEAVVTSEGREELRRRLDAYAAEVRKTARLGSRIDARMPVSVLWRMLDLLDAPA